LDPFFEMGVFYTTGIGYTEPVTDCDSISYKAKGKRQYLGEQERKWFKAKFGTLNLSS